VTSFDTLLYRFSSQYPFYASTQAPIPVNLFNLIEKEYRTKETRCQEVSPELLQSFLETTKKISARDNLLHLARYSMSIY